MRSIPFKVVALLGMDFDKFPRKETALSFSLLNDLKELKMGSWWARYKSAGTCVYTAEINNATFCKHEQKIEN